MAKKSIGFQQNVSSQATFNSKVRQFVNKNNVGAFAFALSPDIIRRNINNNRTVANIRSYFNKCNGNMGTSGSVVFMFDHSCNFRINAEGLDAEEVELEFIDFGAEEVFADDDGILIYAPFESFGAIQSALESRNIEILSSGFDRIPQVTKTLSGEQTIDVDKLIEKLEEDDDVQNVYHTMQE